MAKDPNILRVSEDDIKRAVREMLEREQPEVAARIRHLMMKVTFDEHSYVPVEVNVHLNPEAAEEPEIVVLEEDVEGLGKAGDEVRITSSGAERVPGDAHLPPVSPEVKAGLLRRINEDT